MNELIESDADIYAADAEDIYLPVSKKKTSERDKLKADIQNQLNADTGVGILSNNPIADEAIFQELFDEDEISLEDPEEHRLKHKERKENDAKIHNSFTGPYPLDPTEFSHTDKGENYQFTNITQE